MSDWTPLRDALRRARDHGTKVRLWWRDDDAVTETDALRRLVRMADDTGVPVHLAIIPKRADETLLPYIAKPDVQALVHGWAHENHSPPDQKKAEFGQPRDDGLAELSSGLSRMQTLFPAHALPVFVPPWNRLHDDYRAALAGLGYRGVSVIGDRPLSPKEPDLITVNAHIDPIHWRNEHHLLPLDGLVDLSAKAIHDRIDGRADPAEPIGLLSHHLVHRETVWDFCRTWLTEMTDGGAIPWAWPQELD